jgi:hypothetical protein
MSPPFEPNDYGPVLAQSIGEEPLQPLDSGSIDTTVEAMLSSLTVETAFAHTTVIDRPMAECCLAGIWLLHNGLDPAHNLCQDVPTPSGSYWHGVMHRREGDFGNAQYWFRRAGDHPAGKAIADHATASPVTASLALSGDWDAVGFVDLCREALRGSDQQLLEACLMLQQDEWRALFDWCYLAAIE